MKAGFVLAVVMLTISCGEGTSLRQTDEGPERFSSETDQAGEIPTITPGSLPPRYAGVNRDTNTVRTELRIGNGKYPLSISHISLNDSAVSNITPPSAVEGEAGRKVVLHNKAWRIQFEYEGDILDTVITKEIFAGVLADPVLERSVFQYCGFCFVRSNTLYFQAVIGSQGMGDSQWVGFNIFFRGPKRGIIYGFLSDAEAEPCRSFGGPS